MVLKPRASSKALSYNLIAKVKLLRHRETVLGHTFRRKELGKEQRKLLKQLGIKTITSHHQRTKYFVVRTCRAGHAQTLGLYPSTLGEIDSLEFTKLSSSIGVVTRLLGLSIATGIVSFKVIRRAKNPRAFRLRSVNLSNSIQLAVIGLTKTLSRELGSDGIRVNIILPGWTYTERVEELIAARTAVLSFEF